MSKLRQQVMQALNIKIRNTPGQTKLVYNSYKDSLDNVLDSYIDNTVANTIHTKSCPLKLITLVTQPETLFDIPLLSRLFDEVASGRDKDSSFSTKRSLSSMLPPSIVPREPSNPLIRLNGNYGKQRKRKPRASFMSWHLRDLGYITDQSGSQDPSAVSKDNTDCLESSW